MSFRSSTHRSLALIAKQRAFTLLEVLVALVVLSIGLLGISKLVLVSSRGNDSAYMRSQATALAYTILDSMRANRQAAMNGDYNVSIGTYSSSQNCLTATCDASQAAVADLASWKNTLATQLPSGDGSIATGTENGADGLPRTTATITVQWNDWVAQQSFGGASGNATVSITLETIL